MKNTREALALAVTSIRIGLSLDLEGRCIGVCLGLWPFHIYYTRQKIFNSKRNRFGKHATNQNSPFRPTTSVHRSSLSPCKILVPNHSITASHFTACPSGQRCGNKSPRKKRTRLSLRYIFVVIIIECSFWEVCIIPPNLAARNRR